MAFPTIPTGGRVLTTNQADTSGTRTFPDLSSLTKNNGDLLIAIIVTYSGNGTATFSSWGGSFTEFYDNASGTGAATIAIGAAYKWSTGSETGTFTVTQAATVTGHASMILLSIPGAHATSAPEAGGYNLGTNANPDIASFNPSWAAEDILWIAVGASGMTSAAGTWTATGTPAITSYSNAVDTNTTDNSTVGQTEACVLFRQLNADSENPGAFTSMDTSNATNAGALIAVRPLPSTSPDAGLGSATAAAQTATEALGINAGLGSATAAAQTANDALGTNAPAGSATAVAYDATVSTSVAGGNHTTGGELRLISSAA